MPGCAAPSTWGAMAAFVQPGPRSCSSPIWCAPWRLNSRHHAPGHPDGGGAARNCRRGASGVVESPGGPANAALCATPFAKTGIAEAAAACGAEVNEDQSGVQVSHPEGVLLHRLDLLRAATEVDVIINLPKSRHTTSTGLTLASRTCLAWCPAPSKIGYHAKLQERERFAQALLDIYTYARPALSLMDAVVGMEGNGPTGGTPRAIGALVASADTLACDTVCAALVGLDPLRVLTTEVGVQRGLCTGRLEDVNLVGDALAERRIADFKLGMDMDFDPGLLPRALRRLARPLLGTAAPSDEGQPRRRRAHPLVSHSRTFNNWWRCPTPLTPASAGVLRAPLPGECHHHRGGQGADGPSHLHPLLLLSRTVPRDRYRVETTVAGPAAHGRLTWPHRIAAARAALSPCAAKRQARST